MLVTIGNGIEVEVKFGSLFVRLGRLEAFYSNLSGFVFERTR